MKILLEEYKLELASGTLEFNIWVDVRYCEETGQACSHHLISAQSSKSVHDWAITLKGMPNALREIFEDAEARCVEEMSEDGPVEGTWEDDYVRD